jgi:hypothetical protein
MAGIGDMMKSFLQDVAKKWKGAGLLYLLLLACLTMIPFALHFHSGVGKIAVDKLYPLVDKIPDIKIARGQVSINKPEPYFLTTPGGRAVGVIDTTGKVTSLENGKYYLLLTKNSLMYRQSDTETRTYNLSKVEDFSLTRDQVKKWSALGVKWAGFAAYPFLAAFSYAWRIIQALIYALIGLIFAKLARTKLSYSSLMRLSAVALTLTAVADAVLEILGNPYRISNLMSIGITLILLFIACRANASDEETPPAANNPGV